MVFRKNLYYYLSFLCRATGIAINLVASTNDAGMENLTHNRNTGSQLDFVPNHNGIHSYSQGVLQAT